jgi:hypothetical protein
MCGTLAPVSEPQLGTADDFIEHAIAVSMANISPHN